MNTEQSICRQHREACYHKVPVYTQQLYTHAKSENCNILLHCYESEELLSLTPSIWQEVPLLFYHVEPVPAPAIRKTGSEHFDVK